MDDKPRPGRTPFGGRTSVYLSLSTQREMRSLANQFGQRRFAAIARIAIRRMMTNSPILIAERVERRRPWSIESVPTPIFLGEELRSELDHFAGKIGAPLSELVRLACDMLLTELATARLDGNEIDLTEAVNAEVYRGSEPSRSRIIRRHELRQQKAAVRRQS